jgi:hypothetical protein
MNIYYLPARPSEASEMHVSTSNRAGSAARLDLLASRIRVMTFEVWSALRRGGRTYAFDEPFWLTDETAPRPRRPAGPARVIDLDAARRRRLLNAAPARA